MYRFLNCVFIVLGFANFLHGMILEKNCPLVEDLVDNFNSTAFLGTWYEIARYPNEYEMIDACKFIFGVRGSKMYAQFIGSSALPKDDPNYLETTYDLAPENKGILLHDFTFGSPPVKYHLTEYILSTDYNRYYISYACQFDENIKSNREYAWIVTRTKYMDSDLRTTIFNYIKSSKILNIEKFYWLDVNDKACAA